MSRTARPLLFNPNEFRRLGYKYRSLEAAVWPVATAGQETEKPKRSRKGG